MHTHETAPNRFIKADGFNYAYRRFGVEDGVPLVFLNRFRGTMDEWDPSVTNGLAKTRPVILFDNAGVGLTSGETPDSVEAMARHVTAFVDALGLQQVDLLGFSLGGFVAQQVVLDRPALVRRVILAGTGPKGGAGMESFTPEVTEAATHVPGRAEDLLFLFFAKSKTSQEQGKEFLGRTMARTVDREPATTVQTMGAQAKAIAGWGSAPNGDYEYLRKIKQPALVVNGASDIMIPTVNSFLMSQHMPNAQLIVYPDAGHGALFQYHDRFVVEAELFLDA